MKVACKIEYDGSRFSGSQRQPGNIDTVQGCFEECLQRLFKRNITLVAAGRTDSGVHANGQVVSFEVPTEMETVKLRGLLNSKLPRYINVCEVWAVSDDFHPRFSAISREYVYKILESSEKLVYLDSYFMIINRGLDVGFIRRASQLFNGEHDFKTFCHVGSNENTTIRTISELSLKQKDVLVDGAWFRSYEITVKANAFLYRMIRSIITVLLMFEKRELEIVDILEMLKGNLKEKIGPRVVPNGLYLQNVNY
jgi:tRNA pseudouridine38-40 synthase